MSEQPLSDLTPFARPKKEMLPIDPGDLMHYVAACTVAQVPVAAMSSAVMRAQIARCKALSIPDAVKLLRKGAPR